MMNDKITAKIEKLLALAGNNPNQAEAQAALLKAQELMAEYNIEVTLSGEEKIEYGLEICIHPNNNGYRIPLSVIIAENFRCKPIIMNGSVAFLGRKSDAKIAKQTFEYAYKVIRKGIIAEERKYRDMYGSTRGSGINASYSTGFLSGLKARFDEQCKALMIITPPDVHEEFSRRFPKTGKHKGGIQNTGLNLNAYEKGHKDGKSLMDSRQIEG